MDKILVLATAGLKPRQLCDKSHTLHPRVDYIELQNLLGARVMDYGVYQHTPFGRVFRYLETQVRSDLYLTLLGWILQTRFDMVFAMSERVGIPYAGLRRTFPSQKPFITMFQSWSMRQEKTITKLNLFPGMDAIAVHCQSMKAHLASLGAPDDRIHVLPYSVDQDFFTPLRHIEPRPGLIMSIGETRSRDYATLISAVDGIPARLVIAASGPWYAREKNTDLHVSLPENIDVVKYLPRHELKELYSQANFVVVPVYDQVFSAGATSVLEAGCMERAVIVTRSPGIMDFVVDGETGILVEPGNAEQMREAIRYLSAHPEDARRLGKNARQRIESLYTFEKYVDQMAELLLGYEKQRVNEILVPQ